MPVERANLILKNNLQLLCNAFLPRTTKNFPADFTQFSRGMNYFPEMI